MNCFTGYLLVLALLLIGGVINNSYSRKVINSTKNVQILAGNILKLYNRQMHRIKIALLKRQQESNDADLKSVMFNSEGEILDITKKSKRDVNSTEILKSVITFEDRINLLVAHNHWRRVVDNPQASNMIYMVWSLDLEKIAFGWASNCRYDEGFPDDIPDKFMHPGVSIGQSIWSRIGSYNVEAAIEDFYNEKMHCSQKNKCRHYKQVVWAESIYLGCSIVYCPTYLAISSLDKRVFNLVCNYWPGGNTLSAKGIPVESFRIGPAGTQCPSTHPNVENGLCRTNPPCSDVRECDSLSYTTCLCDLSYYEGNDFEKSLQDDDAESAGFMKSSAKGNSCFSVKLRVSSISLSCTVFVTFVVTYALSLESATMLLLHSYIVSQHSTDMPK